MTTLNKDQLTDLVDEFVSFKMNDMSQDDIYQYLSDIAACLGAFYMDILTS